MGIVPGRPGWGLSLEGRLASDDAGEVNRSDGFPVFRSHRSDLNVHTRSENTFTYALTDMLTERKLCHIRFGVYEI